MPMWSAPLWSSALWKLSPPGSGHCELCWENKPNSRMWWPGQFQPVYLCGGHCLKSSFFLTACLLGQKPPRHDRGQQETWLFIQVPLSQGATLPAGLGSDLRANDDTIGGVLLYHTERQGLGGRGTQTKPVSGASSLICQVFTSAV